MTRICSRLIGWIATHVRNIDSSSEPARAETVLIQPSGGFRGSWGLALALLCFEGERAGRSHPGIRGDIDWRFWMDFNRLRAEGSFMAATRDSSQPITFVFTSLHDVYRKGLDAARNADVMAAPQDSTRADLEHPRFAK